MDKRYMFRGRSFNSGIWFYGQPHKYNENKVFIVGGNVIDWDAEWISIEYWAWVDPATVGQCTGLIATKSYRGDGEDARLVFEGDIVAHSDNYCTVQGIVRFGGIGFHVGFYIEWIDYDSNKWSDWWGKDLDYWITHEQCKIVGTIHEHPELLNGGGQGRARRGTQ